MFCFALGILDSREVDPPQRYSPPGRDPEALAGEELAGGSDGMGDAVPSFAEGGRPVNLSAGARGYVNAELHSCPDGRSSGT